jgi:hypothetical protein
VFVQRLVDPGLVGAERTAALQDERHARPPAGCFLACAERHACFRTFSCACFCACFRFRIHEFAISIEDVGYCKPWSASGAAAVGGITP